MAKFFRTKKSRDPRLKGIAAYLALIQAYFRRF